MKCNFDTKSNTSFGKIYSVSGGEQFLKRTLNKAERSELSKLIESQKENPVSITLAEHTDKLLEGWITFEEKTDFHYHRKDYTQRRFFDSPLNFIKRLCKKADKFKEKYSDNIQELNDTQFELRM